MSQHPFITAAFRAAILTIASISSTSQGGLAGDTPAVIFERYKLIGIFALDCGKPAAYDNFYYVFRALPDGRIQGDRMSSQQTRDLVDVVDTASERQPGDISINSTTAGGKANSSVWRIEGQRFTVLEYTVDGRVSAGDGQWLNRCND